MGSYKTKRLVAALQKKGFKQQQSRHHDYFWLYVGNKKTAINTYVSRGESDFSEPILSARRKQMSLATKDQILNFIDCSLSHDAYVEFLIQSKAIVVDDPGKSEE